MPSPVPSNGTWWLYVLECHGGVLYTGIAKDVDARFAAHLDGTGAIFCHTGVSEQGQGAEAVIAQCVATSFGVPMDRVRVIMGDTDNTPYGGGTWASRAAGIGGGAASSSAAPIRSLP